MSESGQYCCGCTNLDTMQDDNEKRINPNTGQKQYLLLKTEVIRNWSNFLIIYLNY